MSTLIDKYQCGPLIKFGKYNLQKWRKNILKVDLEQLFKSNKGKVLCYLKIWLSLPHF
jgi:hypothetical protein